jgi:hypothetical protein
VMLATKTVMFVPSKNRNLGIWLRNWYRLVVFPAYTWTNIYWADIYLQKALLDQKSLI